MMRQRVLSSLSTGRIAAPSLVRTLRTTSTSSISPLSRPILRTRLASPFFEHLQQQQKQQCRSFSSSTPGSDPSTSSTSSSPTDPPQLPLRERSKFVKGCLKVFAFTGFACLTLSGAVLAFFLYDASTYKEYIDEHDIGVPAIALNPRRGGPKNLPIAEVLVDDCDGTEMLAQKDKPRLVILGCGWGSVALLKNINPENYHITVISPSNYFLYTPLLPSATVGTLEVRSLIEPIRRITSDVKGHFMKATAEDVCFSEKLVEVSQVMPDGEERRFYVPYDKLVVGVGSITRTHGVEGLQYVNYLKSVNDARLIRSKVIENFEQACLPTTSDEERRRLLSFVVCGGGPTGVEFAAELFDMLNEDLAQKYPRILRNEVSVHIVQSRSHILNTYDEALSRYAEEKFARNQIDVLTDARVSRIEKDKVIFTQTDPETHTTVTKELPYGLCLWSTGVAQTEFAQRIANKIEVQKNSHALETDPHLRLLGTPLGDVYCIGDCSTVQNNITAHITEFVRHIAWENGIKDERNINLTFSQWRSVVPRIKRRFPQTCDHLRRLDKLFEEYDQDRSGTLDFDELKKLLEQIDAKLTSLPATAQRAHQQGEYLAKKFNILARAAPGLELNQIQNGDVDEAVYKAFEYKHLGSLAYIGNAAVFDWGNGINAGGGIIYLYIWRSVYFAQSVSMRTRMLMAMDWTKRALFGRDLMNF
ncbi:hypothetical protein BZA77DRAFT_50983 [Pyronema omphalodes]|nr:hypothetical protein BZA77DRAFT_50983 [Pyronema omphalodes]